MDPETVDQLLTLIPITIFCLAGLIVAVIGSIAFVLLRRSSQPGTAAPIGPGPPSTETTPVDSGTTTPPPLAIDLEPDIYLDEQRSALQEFSLEDLAVAYRGVTGQGYRQGVIVHHNQPDVPLIAFVTQTGGGQVGQVKAATVYGDMDLAVTAGQAELAWNDQELGTLDYKNQRIMGDEGQLLGELSRPAAALDLEPEDQHYPISFFGQKAGELHFAVEGLSDLRWISDTEEGEQRPAFRDLNPDLDDAQQIFMMSALVMEVGFFDFLRSMR